jgi:hypothetical protein
VAKRDPSQKQGLGGGCLFVFGLIFFAAGMIPGFLAFSSLWQWYQAGQWTPVSATIESSRLNASTSDGSTTYEVTGRFSYHFQDRDYSSKKIHFSGGSDNIGSYHQDTHALLQRHQRNGEPMTAWVNPDNPYQAVLIRDMRWGLFAFMMIFPLLFGGVGAVIMGVSILGAGRLREENRRQQAHPEEPWRWRPEWATGEINCESKGIMWFAIGFAVVWNLISAPLAFFLPEEIFEKGNTIAALGLIFPLVGIGLAVWAVRAFIRWRKFGKSALHMHQLPAPLGGQLKAELRCPTAIDARQMHFTLSNINKVTSGSGKNRSTRENVLWQDDCSVSLGSTSQHLGARVPVTFRLPADGRPSDESRTNNQVLWRLEANAEVPGVDFAAQFTVPVFDTGETFAAEAQQAIENHEENGDWTRTGVVVSLTPMGTRYYFAAARQPMMATIVSVFGLFFSAATFFLWREDAWFMAVVFGLFSVLSDYAALARWFKRHELMANRMRLRVRSGLFGLGSGKEYPSQVLKGIEVKAGMQSGSKRYWDLVAIREGESQLALGGNLASRRDSEALARHLRQSLGIR